MNDQELPESDASRMEVEPATDSTLEPQTMKVEEELNESTIAFEVVDEFEEEELTDEELDDVSDVDDEDELAIDAAKSLMEELFDENDFVEEMSELDVLTLEDAANYLKVEYGAIRRLLKEQGLPGRKIGDEWRFLRGAIADWLRAPGGIATPAAVPDRPAQADRPAHAERSEHRPERQDRREFTARPPVQDRSNQGGEGSRYQRPGARYPQQGEGNRYPQQEGQPPRRPRYPSDEQQGGGNQGGSYQRPGNQQGGYQGGYQGNQGGGGQAGGQGSYPPPRRPRFGNDQNQQPQGEYRPPRRPPFAGGPGGNFDNQSGGNAPAGGSYGGNKFNGGPKKPKRKALNEQRFKRIDRRKEGDNSGEGGNDSGGDEG